MLVLLPNVYWVQSVRNLFTSTHRTVKSARLYFNNNMWQQYVIKSVFITASHCELFNDWRSSLCVIVFASLWLTASIISTFPSLFHLVYEKQCFVKVVKMRMLIFLSFLVLFFLSTCWARDMIVGTSYNTRLVWQQKAEYRSIPFKKRVKEVFYSDPGQQIIRVRIMFT